MRIFGFEIHRVGKECSPSYDELVADIKWCQRHIELIENRIGADGFRDKRKAVNDEQIMEILRSNPANRNLLEDF